MKRIAYLMTVILCLGCGNDKSCSDIEIDHEGDHPHHGETDSHHGHGSANEEMHQNSVSDLIKRSESPERDEYQQPKKVLDYLGDLQGQTVMDIGAGSGYFSVKLAEKGAIVIAADVDNEFQEYLKNRIEENNIKNIETRKIPYDSPGLNENEVDKVLIVNTYHHIENRPEYFTKVKAGTKPNGELIIIDFYKSELPVGPPCRP